jgi:hypothetical protein
MRRTAWIWLVGCIVWSVDAIVASRFHSAVHARMAFLLAAIFGAAWLFFRSQPR